MWFFFFYTSFFPCGNSGRLIRVRPQQPQEQCYPFLTVRAVFSCVQTKIWLPLFWIYNVRRDVNASDCTGRLYGHRKSLHWKLTVGEKSLVAPGNNQRRAGSTLHQLSYIPTPSCRGGDVFEGALNRRFFCGPVGVVYKWRVWTFQEDAEYSPQQAGSLINSQPNQLLAAFLETQNRFMHSSTSGLFI